MGREMKTECLMLLDEAKGVRARHQHRSKSPQIPDNLCSDGLAAAWWTEPCRDCPRLPQNRPRSSRGCMRSRRNSRVPPASALMIVLAPAALITPSPPQPPCHSRPQRKLASPTSMPCLAPPTSPDPTCWSVSWGGLIAKLYASTYPDQVVGLILVDGAAEFFQETLTPEQWQTGCSSFANQKSEDNEVSDYKPSVTQIRNVPLARIIPSVILTSDKPWDLQVGTPAPASQPGWPEDYHLPTVCRKCVGKAWQGFS